MFASAAPFSRCLAGNKTVLVFRNLLRLRIPFSDSVRRLLLQPYGSVGSGDSGMNLSSALRGNVELLYLARLWIQLANGIRQAEIWNPHVAVLVRSRTERHASRPGQLVRYIHN